MANTKLLVEINDILTRIDKKIEDVKSTVLEATSVATPKMKTLNSFNGSTKKRGSSSLSSFQSLSKVSVKSSTPQNFKFQPSICKKSLKIAKNLESSKNRLVKTPNQKPTIPVTYSFAPEINEKSTRILKKTQRNTEKPWEALYENSVFLKIKQENARKLANIVDLDTKEFTFKPVLNKSKKVSPGLLKRNSSWLQNKAEKIALISRAEQLKEVEECTFFPQTTELRQNDGEATGINGVHEFLMRHQSARRNKSQENSIKSISTYKDLTVNEYIEAVKGLNDYLHSINIE